MNDTVNRDERCDVKWKKYQHTPTGKILAGIWVVAVGAVLLSRQLGVEYPSWLFTWPVMLMVIGIYIGARHMFSNPGWIITVTIGGLFLWDLISPEFQLSTYIWPILIILAGVLMIFKPQRKQYFLGGHKRYRSYMKEERSSFKAENEAPLYTHENIDGAANENWHYRKLRDESTQQDYLEAVAIFGAVRKSVLSKTFKGGEIICVFGGAEINFMQADIHGKVVLDITCVLGGAKLIIPSHWDVQPETMAILGGIEDKRQINANVSTDKILVLKGTTCIGGIEIKSF